MIIPSNQKNHFNKWNHQGNSSFGSGFPSFFHTFRVPFFTMKSRNKPSGGSRSICSRWVGGCFDTRGQGNVGRASTEFLEVLGIRHSRIVIQAGVKPRRPAAIHGELRNCIETVCCNDIFLRQKMPPIYNIVQDVKFPRCRDRCGATLKHLGGEWNSYMGITENAKGIQSIWIY